MMKPALPNGKQVLNTANKQIVQSWQQFCNFIGQTEIIRRKNWVTQEDHQNALEVMKKGDIMVTGLYRTIGWAAVIRDLVNHTIYYAGDGKIIHARMGGVGEETLEWACKYYDGFIVLRMKDYKKNSKLIPSIDEFIRSRIGLQYNYSFAERQDKYVCTQLINDAFQYAGYDTKLKSFQTRFLHLRRWVPFIFLLKAQKFLSDGNFDIVFTTHTYEVRGDRIVISVPAHKNHLKKFLFEANVRLKNK